jgi:hypothetical protein
MTHRFLLGAAVFVTLTGVACGVKKPERPSRETVLPLLQQEAATIKADGEKVNPALGLKSTWNVEAVEVQEQAGNDEQPWRGFIRFRIETKMREPDGTEINDRLDKKFDYAYEQMTHQWRMQVGK